MVYFVQSIDSDLIKIGYTGHITTRLSQMRSQSGSELQVLGLIEVPNAEALEEKLHKRFKKHRVRGEWFAPVPELIQYIGRHSEFWYDDGWEQTIHQHAVMLVRLELQGDAATAVGYDLDAEPIPAASSLAPFDGVFYACLNGERVSGGFGAPAQAWMFAYQDGIRRGLIAPITEF